MKNVSEPSMKATSQSTQQTPRPLQEHKTIRQLINEGKRAGYCAQTKQFFIDGKILNESDLSSDEYSLLLTNARKWQMLYSEKQIKGKVL